MSRRRKRILIAATVTALVVIGTQDFLVQRLALQQYRLVEVTRVQTEMGFLRASIEESITKNLLRVGAMGAYVAVNPDLSSDEFDRFARQMLAQGDELRNLAGAPNLVISYVYPLEGNETILGVDYRSIAEQWPRVQLAMRTGEMVVDGPLELIQGGTGLVARVPVYVREDDEQVFWGIVSSLLDFELITGDLERQAAEFGIAVALRRRIGDRHQPILGDVSLFETDALTPARISVPNDEWQIVAAPVDGWETTAPFAWVIHATSLAMLAVVLTTVWVRLRRDERAEQVARAYQEQLERFFGQSLLGAFFTRIDSNGTERVARVNDAMLALYRAKREEIVGRPLEELFSVPRDLLERTLRRADSGDGVKVELPFVLPDGTRVEIEGYYRPMLDQRGALSGHFGLQRDVTSEREASSKLDRYVGIVDSNVITSQTDLEGRITYASSAFCSASGFTLDELLGARHSIVRHPDAPAEQYARLWETVSNGRIWHGEMMNRRKDGTTYWVEADISPLLDRDGRGMGYMSVQQDITAKKLVERLSVTDPLTGISNRLQLDKVLAREHGRFVRYGHAYSILLLDIDHFKTINDELGHLTGDVVIQGVGRLVAAKTRSTDHVGRWGGEEFLVICPHTDIEGAIQLGELLRSAIEGHDFGIGRTVTTSVGVAASSSLDTDEASDRLVAEADRALYAAKQGGRNRVCSAGHPDHELGARDVAGAL
ncbi:MAG: diguanylate cyclase [Spirochaetota bacterium]